MLDFFLTYKSGTKAPASGVYSCTDCGNERTVKKGVRLPPCHGEWSIAKRTTKRAKSKKKGFLESLFG